MLVVDANVLINAVNEEARDHDVAHRWLVRALGGSEALGFPWMVCLAFLRVATHPAVFAAPLSAEHAGTVLDAWLAAPAAIVAQPTPRHLMVLRALLADAGTAGNLVNDAHLAALALEHHATVVTFDRDFDRFGVRWQRPGD